MIREIKIGTILDKETKLLNSILKKSK